MVSLVNSHTNATRIGWHLWEIDLRFAPGLRPGWLHDHVARPAGSRVQELDAGVQIGPGSNVLPLGSFHTLSH